MKAGSIKLHSELHYNNINQNITPFNQQPWIYYASLAHYVLVVKYLVGVIGFSMIFASEIQLLLQCFD